MADNEKRVVSHKQRGVPVFMSLTRAEGDTPFEEEKTHNNIMNNINEDGNNNNNNSKDRDNIINSENNGMKAPDFSLRRRWKLRAALGSLREDFDAPPAVRELVLANCSGDDLCERSIHPRGGGNGEGEEEEQNNINNEEDSEDNNNNNNSDGEVSGAALPSPRDNSTTTTTVGAAVVAAAWTPRSSPRDLCAPAPPRRAWGAPTAPTLRRGTIHSASCCYNNNNNNNNSFTSYNYNDNKLPRRGKTVTTFSSSCPEGFLLGMHYGEIRAGALMNGRSAPSGNDISAIASSIVTSDASRRCKDSFSVHFMNTVSARKHLQSFAASYPHGGAAVAQPQKKYMREEEEVDILSIDEMIGCKDNEHIERDNNNDAAAVTAAFHTDVNNNNINNNNIHIINSINNNINHNANKLALVSCDECGTHQRVMTRESEGCFSILTPRQQSTNSLMHFSASAQGACQSLMWSPHPQQHHSQQQHLNNNNNNNNNIPCHSRIYSLSRTGSEENPDGREWLPRRLLLQSGHVGQLPVFHAGERGEAVRQTWRGGRLDDASVSSLILTCTSSNVDTARTCHDAPLDAMMESSLYTLNSISTSI